nr:hypothetical protein [Leucobacter aridicollis]
MDFIHDVSDCLHGIRHVALSEFLLRRDETHALLEKLPLGDRRIREVSKHARSHVDHDELHLGMLIQVAQQLFELGSFVNRLRRLAWLDKFSTYRCAKFLDLAHRLDSLRSDAVPVFV